MHRYPWHHMGFSHCHGFMSVEEEIEMLEKSKEHIETMLKNINERLEKLKE